MKNVIMTQPYFDKQILKNALLEALDAAIDAAMQAAREAQATASHEGNKPENKWDTLALEAAYLAHGQSERILKLQQQRIALGKWTVPDLDADDTIRNGACVTVGLEGVHRHLFIAPLGGYQLRIDNSDAAAAGVADVVVVSHETPLARALTGRCEGDEVTLTLGGKSACWEIIGIC